VVALLCVSPPEDEGVPGTSYAALRLQAALVAAERLAGAEVHLVELPTADVDGLVARLEQIRPDVVGASAYIWSFPALVEVARRLRRTRPDTLVVFGGPSARPSMFALPPFAAARPWVDALVVGEGEEAMVDVVAVAARRRERLAEVTGLLLPTREGWRPTAPRPALAALDDLPSPYQMGLVPPGRKGRLETYRGCPVRCAFCQAPGSDPLSRLHSKEHLVRELQALRAARADRVCLIDSAINLNSRAFRNLRDAEREVGLFQEQRLYVNVYPSTLDAAHLDFLHAVRGCWVSIGVQSFNRDALAHLSRPFSQRRFERMVSDLVGIDTSIELIVGLPFDSPSTFLATLDRLLESRLSVLVSHCLVLPDTFAGPAARAAKIRFDERTLKLVSCAGWTEAALRETCAVLDRRVRETGGRVTEYSWEFFAESGRPHLGPGDPGRPGGPAGPRPGAPAPPPDAGTPVPAPLARAMAAGVVRGSGGRWALEAATLDRGRLVARASTPAGELVVEAQPAHPGRPSFRVVDGVAWSYRQAGAAPPEAVLRQLEGVIAEVRQIVARLLEGPPR
jgi:hypothetical protein